MPSTVFCAQYFSDLMGKLRLRTAKGQIQGCMGRKGESWNLNLGLSDYRALLFAPLRPSQCIWREEGKRGGEQRKGSFLTTEITHLLAYIPCSLWRKIFVWLQLNAGLIYHTVPCSGKGLHKDLQRLSSQVLPLSFPGSRSLEQSPSQLFKAQVRRA